jgi:hypothetical protein
MIVAVVKVDIYKKKEIKKGGGVQRKKIRGRNM